MEPPHIDHLFRHHYGKMVSVLTRIFGLQHLDTIEDAIQDTFIKASQSWKINRPENPEAWLTKAAKNRVLDLFRTFKAQQKHASQYYGSMEALAINELFLDSEIADSQLRMIFTACHSSLDPKDRIAFALKTVSGFSTKEIASALLTKEETIKKRLTRARKHIQKEEINFKIPHGSELPGRLHNVLEVLYLIFNEGFHSNKQEMLVRKELCAEAMRLNQLLFKNRHTKTGDAYALFALMCFHAARLDAKTNIENEVIDLKQQDRSLWYFPLVQMGDMAMHKAVAKEIFSTYHYEAAIASEHLKAKTFAETDWIAIQKWYKALYQLQPLPSHLLNMAVVALQRKDFRESEKLLSKIDIPSLGQRQYLYYGTLAEHHFLQKNYDLAILHIQKAIDMVNNTQEKKYLEKKRLQMLL